MRKDIIAFASLMIALAFLAGAAFQVTAATAAVVGGCEYPLFIQQGAVDANVLILFDTSGSMNEAIYHSAFNPSTSYSGNFNRTKMYYVGSDGTYDPRDFSGSWPNSPSAYLVDSDGGEDGRYIGNYLNWIYFHATSAQRAAIPAVTRIQVAKPAVNSVVANNANIRFGVWGFDYDDGAGPARAALGTDHATIQTIVSGLIGDGYTPIGESMEDIYLEVKGSNAVQYECQKTFMVVMTDGLPTQDGDDTSADVDTDGDGEWIDDYAKIMRDGDVATHLDDDQAVYTYTIGFNVDANVLQDMADAGDGLYISANNPQELTDALERVLRDVINRISSGSAVAVVSTEGNTQDFLFRGKFMPGLWKGFLEAFALPYEEGEAPYWEAGAILESRSASSREIYTAVDITGGGTLTAVDFTASYVTPLMISMGIADATVAANVINWTRGEDIAGMRDRRGWKLADVIESSPLVVGPPMGFSLVNDYLAWRTANENRKRVIYIGSNGGMVHCFDEADGTELWAWVPQGVHGDLQALSDTSYCHRFTCNLTPKVFDSYVNNSWRTIMIAGLKQGGDSYLCLDVTDPENPQFMWEQNQIAVMNESWATPEIVRLSTGQVLAFVGTGPDDTNGEARLIALDVSDGSVADGWMLSDNGGSSMNMATGARSLDIDFDGDHDLLYVADMEGNLWRMDLDNGDSISNAPEVLFTADTDQAIQAQPIATVDYNDDVFLYFGTGRYVENNDITDTTQNTFYAVTDKHDGQSVSKFNMVNETSSITPVGPNDYGWYFDLLESTGERVVEPDALVAGIVYFTSFAPDTNPCGHGGFSWLYSVDFRNGSAHDDDDDESNDGIDGRVEDIGEGIATKPVIDIVNEEVIVQGSDTRIHVSDAKGTIRQLVVRSWRQRYN